jgi:hypothetical protein
MNMEHLHKYPCIYSRLYEKDGSIFLSIATLDDFISLSQELNREYSIHTDLKQVKSLNLQTELGYDGIATISVVFYHEEKKSLELSKEIKSSKNSIVECKIRVPNLQKE